MKKILFMLIFFITLFSSCLPEEAFSDHKQESKKNITVLTESNTVTEQNAQEINVLKPKTIVVDEGNGNALLQIIDVTGKEITTIQINAIEYSLGMALPWGDLKTLKNEGWIVKEK